MAADQRPDPRAVDRANACQIDDDVAVAAPVELAKLALEGLGGSSSDQRLERRQYEPISDWLIRHAIPTPGAPLR
jgi:hypothetical protein